MKPLERTLRHSKTAPNCVPKPCSNLFTFGGSKLQASGFQNGPLATAKQHLIACRNRVQTYPEKLPNVPSEFLEKMSLFSASCSCCLVAPSCKHIRPPERTLRHSAGLNLPAKTPTQNRSKKLPNVSSEILGKKYIIYTSNYLSSGLQNGPFATAKQHLMACRNVMQTYPQKLPNVSSKFLRKCFFFCLLQLLFGSSTLQASGRQNGPFATAKQDLIACRNCVQTYPEKLPNVLSEFLEKNVLFLPPAAVVWWLQAASIRPPERTLHHSKAAPNFQTYPQNIRNVPSEFLDKMSFFCLLLFGGSKLQASSLQNGSFATAKQHLIAYRNRVQTYSRLVAPSCKHQASRTDPSPQQNST